MGRQVAAGRLVHEAIRRFERPKTDDAIVALAEAHAAAGGTGVRVCTRGGGRCHKAYSGSALR